MAKIVRKIMSIFGETAGTDQRAVIGSLAQGSPAFSTDPEAIQSSPNYKDGWFAIAMGAYSPAIEDMNSLCYLFAYQLAYLMQTGVPEWQDATTYYKGSYCSYENKIFVSLTDSNINNPPTDDTNWKEYNNGVKLVEITGYNITSNDDVLLYDTGSSGGMDSYLPPASSVKNKKYTLKNIGTGGALGIYPDGTDKIDGNNAALDMSSSMQSYTLISDGTQWFII